MYAVHTPVVPTAAARRRLAVVVRERMADLGLTQEDLRVRGGPSQAWTRDLLHAEDRDETKAIQPDTLRKLDVGMGWEPGSARRVLAGGEPTPLGSSDDPPQKLDDDPEWVITFDPATAARDLAVTEREIREAEARLAYRRTVAEAKRALLQRLSEAGQEDGES